jgi:hypothetical protein
VLEKRKDSVWFQHALHLLGVGVSGQETFKGFRRPV